MLFLFLVDVGASMAQRFSQGYPLLDAAKNAVEYLIKMRQRDPASRQDRFLLVTTSTTGNVKAGWQTPTAQLLDALKMLQPSSLTDMPAAVRTAFDLMNQYRLVTGIDNYGNGRLPSYLEAALVLVFTDGRPVVYQDGKPVPAVLPPSLLLAAELTTEPYRWDQRVYQFVMSAQPKKPADASSFAWLADATGGSTTVTTSLKALMAAVDGLLGLTAAPTPGGVVPAAAPAPVHQVGVLLDWEEAPADAAAAPSAAGVFVRLAHVRPNNSRGTVTVHWPLPEPAWLDGNTSVLVPRRSHPLLSVTPVDRADLVVPDYFPQDQYDVDACPCTERLLQRPAGTAWQVAIRQARGARWTLVPCGLLRANPPRTGLQLVVLPYNYPQLLPLLGERAGDNDVRSAPVPKQKMFEIYLQSVPPYYVQTREMRQYLKAALRRCGYLALFGPDGGRAYDAPTVGPSVTTYLRHLKATARPVLEQAVAEGRALTMTETGDVRMEGGKPTGPAPRRAESTVLPPLRPRKPAVMVEQAGAAPEAVDRRQLLDAIHALRRQLAQAPPLASRPLAAARQAVPDGHGTGLRGGDADKHRAPIADMGDYMPVLTKRPALRDVFDESAERLRRPTFGNPFRTDKRAAIDEAGEANEMAVMARPLAGSGSGGRTRRALDRSRPSSPTPAAVAPVAPVAAVATALPLTPGPEPDEVEPVAPLPPFVPVPVPPAAPTMVVEVPTAATLPASEARALARRVRQLVRSPGVASARKAVAVLRAPGSRLPRSLLHDLEREALRFKRVRLAAAVRRVSLVQ